ncbi:MAG TPA: GTPase ObgE [Planctomycetota bacterium]|nr:GTPase ObgE [Planctomycetota bacterium]
MFVDELEIRVRAGKGGNGCASFLRDKKTLKGGPNGGDGGHGGDVVLLPTTHCNTLYHLTGRGVFQAANGGQGQGSNCSGKGAEDLVIEVPVGTQVLDAERGNVLQDLDTPDRPFVLARGGYGGRGNSRFATSTNRTPRTAEPGTPGEERRVLLSLKLIADVGLLGLPNAGKSTLLATITKARPKIAGYPFTTIEPMLGIAQGPGEATFVVADIPGLIEGASAGRGLGDRFLKHIERTRLLLHLIDCGDLPMAEPEAAYGVLREELSRHSAGLAARPSLVVATKVEDEAGRRRAQALATAIARPVFAISSATGAGLQELSLAIWSMLSELPHRERV